MRGGRVLKDKEGKDGKEAVGKSVSYLSKRCQHISNSNPASVS